MSRRSSMNLQCISLSLSSLPGTSRQESLTRAFANGNITTVETILNTICDMAICAIGSGDSFSIHST